ncbi:hypothetical protein EXIGLDRAFT_842657 [Exidia glandulosa HHB12029]|uniref:Uncharacterized protein n=1 Tax=Exidia glandulosa HHB12029 TaxID=1314781 RepID=A0A165D5S9_EXIGL|nr:hypothetical protein EXIGLDRAFT_842657 [Exidia glandulosa HHB12029]
MDHRPLTPGVTPHPQLPLHALDAAPVSEPLRRSEAPRIRYFFQGFARAETVGWEPQPPTVGTKHPAGLEVDVTSNAKDEEPEESTPVAAAKLTAEPEEVMLLAKTDDEPETPGFPPVERKDDDDAATIVEKVADLDVTDKSEAEDEIPPPPPPASEKRQSTLVDAGPPPPPPARDPFKKDIFDLGQLFAREFTDKYSNCDFIQPLIDDMTTILPEQRVDAEGALYFLRQIRQYMDWFEQRWALKRRDATVGDTMVNGLYTGLNLMGIRKFRWQARIQDPMLPEPGA